MARTKRRRSVVAGGVALVIVLVTAAFAPKFIDEQAPGSPEVDRGRYDLAKAPGNLCDQLDLTGLTGPAGLFPVALEGPTPSRNVTASAAAAGCQVVVESGSRTVRMRMTAGVTVRPEVATAVADYTMMVADTAALNVGPAAVAGLGEQAVVYTAKDAAGRARSSLGIVLGVLDSNLYWQVRVQLDRTDGAGWTDAEQQDLRARLVALVRGSAPAVTVPLTRV